MNKKILYLGTDPEHFAETVVHYPIIQLKRVLQNIPEDLDLHTHLLFTSKNAVNFWFSLLEEKNVVMSEKKFLAIGTITAQALEKWGKKADLVARIETQEGMIEELETFSLHDAYVLYPRSSLSRSLLQDYLVHNTIRFSAPILYETLPQRILPLPDLTQFQEIVFTSPSTVAAFAEIFGKAPKQTTLRSIGPITRRALVEYGLLAYDT